MINDLLSVPDIFNMWKNVDDTTTYETIPKGQLNQTRTLLIKPNDGERKWLSCSFSCPHLPHFSPSFLDGHAIVITTSAKLFGLIINNELTMERSPIQEIVTESSRKLF